MHGFLEIVSEAKVSLQKLGHVLRPLIEDVVGCLYVLVAYFSIMTVT